MKISRILFIICNILFLLLGVGIFITGIYLKVSQADFTELLDSKEFETATALMVSSGIIVAVVSLVGFCGVWLENQCILGLYFVFVVVIFCMELAAGIMGYLYRGKIDDILQDELLIGLRDQKRRTAWNNVQNTYECCGVHNYTNWHNVYSKVNPSEIPDSCCGFENCGTSGGIASWRDGCYEKAVLWLKDNFVLIGVVGVVIGLLQIILMIVAMVLIFMIRRSKQYI